MKQKMSFTKTGLLIPGIFTLSLHEIEENFGSNNSGRQKLFRKSLLGFKNLKLAGVLHIWLDGSFITQKELPNDIDGCWEAHEQVNPKVLDPIFLDFTDGRKAMKNKYGLDFFIAEMVEGASGVPFVEFFQTERNGDKKGIVHVDLAKEPF